MHLLDRSGVPDKEWILLIQTAKEMGISIEEVKLFIDNCQALENSCREQSSNLEEVLTNT